MEITTTRIVMAIVSVVGIVWNGGLFVVFFADPDIRMNVSLWGVAVLFGLSAVSHAYFLRDALKRTLPET